MTQPDYYQVLKIALEEGTIASMRDIPGIVPITILTRDIKLNYNTISKRLLEPSRLTAADIFRLAKLTGVEPKEWLIQIMKEIDHNRG